MNTFAILFCTVLLAACAVVRGDDAVPSTCLEKMGLSLTDLPGLIVDTSEEGIRKRGCLQACIMQKVGLMNGNTIDMEKIDEHMEKVLGNSDQKESIRQSVHQCATESANDDECVVAQNFGKCGLEHLKLRLQQLIQQAA